MPDSTTSLTIRRATPADLPAVERLLTANGLILDDVAEGIGGFLVAEEGSAIIATIGLEAYPPFGLLRSAAVEPARQGSGLGARLMDRLVVEARQRQLRALYLFTPSAAGFFERHGFVGMERDALPVEVKASGQFTHSCGASAVTMVRRLG